MSVVRYEELDQLAGELLPERTVLGVVSTPFNNVGSGGGFFPGSDGHGAAIVSSCQTTMSPQGQGSGGWGLLGDLGISGGSPAFPYQSCTPSTAVGSF
jgi:hypothetical protein